MALWGVHKNIKNKWIITSRKTTAKTHNFFRLYLLSDCSRLSQPVPSVFLFHMPHLIAVNPLTSIADVLSLSIRISSASKSDILSRPLAAQTQTVHSDVKDWRTMFQRLPTTQSNRWWRKILSKSKSAKRGRQQGSGSQVRLSSRRPEFVSQVMSWFFLRRFCT